MTKHVDRYTGEPSELTTTPVMSGTEIRTYALRKAREHNISNTWAEFGVERGLSALVIQAWLPEDGKLYLFDSFEGLPEPWYADKGIGHRKSPGIPEFADARIEIKIGLFADTLPLDDLLGFVHIDCDIYSSTKTALAGISVAPGTIILFDELWGYGAGENSDAWKEHEYKALMEWDRAYKFIARDRVNRAAIEVTE